MKNSDTPSLLTYLHSSLHPVSLKIFLSSENGSHPEVTDYPFRVIDDSNPFIRLIEAQFVTDAGSELTKVFLLVQRDHYLIAQVESLPIHNQDIDEGWQKAFSLQKEEEGEGSIKILSHQMDDQGKLLPFQALFFCKSKHLFFPPPCPRCGSPLEQCYNEDLLSRSGLQPYSTSLKRYLFCPPCFLMRDSHFYAYELEDSESSSLKDRKALIREFGRLIEMNKQGIQFPCIECPDQSICYGPENRGLSRVVPFAFYPFYLLISEVPSFDILKDILNFSPIPSEGSFPDRPSEPLEVNRSLFLEEQEDVGKTDSSGNRAENRAIHDILIKILHQWQARVEFEKRAAPTFQTTQRNSDIPETVILSPSVAVPVDSSPFLQRPSKDFEGKAISSIEDETLKMTPKTGKETYPDDFLAETVILSPKKIQDKKKDGRKE